MWLLTCTVTVRGVPSFDPALGADAGARLGLEDSRSCIMVSPIKADGPWMALPEWQGPYSAVHWCVLEGTTSSRRV